MSHMIISIHIMYIDIVKKNCGVS